MPVSNYNNSIVTLGSTDLPSFNWHVSVGGYGQLGTADVFTSIAALKANNIDLPALSSQQNLPISLTLQGDRVFGGYYLYGHYRFELDRAHLICRDYAGPLFDSNQSISQLNLQNQTVSTFVQQLVNRFGNGLTTDISIANDPPLGNVLNQGTGFVTYSQNPWQLLQWLARKVGANIYTTPDQVLHFVNIKATGTNSILTWRANGSQLGSFSGPATGTANVQPIMNLEFTHQPERYRTFTVILVSYHQQSTIQSIATVTVVGQPINVTGFGTVAANYYTNNTAITGAKLAAALTSQGFNQPVYKFQKSGLNPAQTQMQAEAIAQNIASRLLISQLKCDGNPNLLPLQQINIGEAIAGDLIGFADQPLYINGVDHFYHCPQGDGYNEDAGYWTEIKALTVPPSVSATVESSDMGLGGGI